MTAPQMLLVDDDRALLQALSEALRRRIPGTQVDLCDSAPAALERVAATDYDVVVSDIQMPGMDGLALLAQLRAVRPETPTVLITGQGQYDLAVRALRGGAYDFIQKPIDRDYFMASVDRAFRMRQMARKLDEQKRALEQHTYDLERTVEERTRELRAANRAKDNFLALLAHELRNPLAPLLNAIRLLRLSDDPAILHQAREVAERQVQHMARLLDDLLDVSRITRGKIELRQERLDLRVLVPHAVHSGRPLIEARQHRLTVTLPEQPVWVDADPTRLEQVLANLLNNAAKYTEPGGQITLTVRQEADQAVVSVRDTGIGIAPEMTARIFDLFTQVNHSLARSQGGLGIGLTLVRSLIDLHGGSVSVSSAGIGQGSEFVVRLPARTATEPSPPPGSEVVAEAPRGRSRHVLIVEDNADGREMLRVLLELWGHRVETAEDGPAGLRKALARRPEVALVDIGLPGQDGYEVARQLRASPEGQGIFLVALTGYGQPDDRRRALEAGFDAHLTKPVDPRELAQVLQAGAV